MSYLDRSPEDLVSCDAAHTRHFAIIRKPGQVVSNRLSSESSVNKTGSLIGLV